MASVKDILIKAKSLIDTPEKWCQGNISENSNKERTAYWDNSACIFCSYGALLKVSDSRNLFASDEIELADALLEAAAREMEDKPNQGYITFNDSHTHPEVMKMWDKAIRNAN